MSGVSAPPERNCPAFTSTTPVHFRLDRGTRKVMKAGEAPEAPALGGVPRISRLMALAIRMQDLADQGEVADYADLARLAHVSRARITQIMRLLLLAPEIQGALLFLPRTEGGCGVAGEQAVRRISAVPDWRKQRRMWEEMRAHLYRDPTRSVSC